MTHESEKKLLESELEDLNQKIKSLSYQLSELLNLDCNFGVCTFDPEVDNIQEKIKEVEKKKILIEFLKNHIDQYTGKENF
jgi:hypothetical protein